ncbi:WhiB family transcriptional regulator [Streptomyces sp. NPDC006261]|uniref:WhiB family transcriptional regulator n=1 Tax=Streptomyces sp. NPDC006261 TaxID=3156739 RepID=UPI0033B7DC18
MITLPEFLDGTTPHCTPNTAHLFDSTDPKDEEQARAICADCPLRPACATHALTTPEDHGTWGGLTAGQRRRIRNPDDTAWLDHQGRLRVACGTYKALQAHLRYGETCGPCRAAQAARTERARRVALAVEHEAGGTVTGAAIHRRLGEPTCVRCRAAQARQSAVQRAARRMAQQPEQQPGLAMAS